MARRDSQVVVGGHFPFGGSTAALTQEGRVAPPLGHGGAPGVQGERGRQRRFLSEFFLRFKIRCAAQAEGAMPDFSAFRPRQNATQRGAACCAENPFRPCRATRGAGRLSGRPCWGRTQLGDDARRGPPLRILRAIRSMARCNGPKCVGCPTVEYQGADPVGLVVSLNLRRRHLSEGQRAWVAAQIARLPLGANQHDGSANLPTQSEAATMLNVSERTVRSAAVVRDKAVPELQQKVAKGEVAPSTAAEVARLPEPVQKEIVAKGERLAEARDLFRYDRREGGFEGWCQTRLKLSRSTAYNMIRVYEDLSGSVQGLAHFETITREALYDLARPSTPEEVRVKVQQLLIDGEKVTAADVRRLRDEATRAKDEASTTRMASLPGETRP